MSAPTTTRTTPSATTGRAAARLTAVSKAYGDTRVLDAIDLTIAPGEFVAVLGPSGTGKTTLLRLLNGFEKPDAGEILVPPRVTTVYQEPRLVPAHRVLRNVLLGQRRTKGNKSAALAALTEVGLERHARSWPATLSGGEAQRVALARALVRDPQLLLLDEPFAALDALTRLRMHDLLDRLRERHRPAILLVTHDIDEAIRLADRIVMLRSGSVAIDVRIDVEHPRTITDPRVVDLRERLLGELGIDPNPTKENP
ncbi:ABC transporter ATP-binding protein [Mumia zhuanghuii]|uniref:ABC transporter ATP-binding protein n=2 Tax=Mumia TaxID=1546255 RepID=A0ABW1QMI4_9ACTN|nr:MULTISPECIES: ABC transporter ATP-binding protein [Mumia]KAA1420718.1 ABC transporter ATP-binding protein [Mumia zhuanghuii]